MFYYYYYYYSFPSPPARALHSFPLSPCSRLSPVLALLACAVLSTKDPVVVEKMSWKGLRWEQRSLGSVLFLLCNHPLFYHLRDIFLKSTYCQTQKTMNTCKISGMLIVYWPITIKFRIRNQISKPPISYRCCLRFSYLAPYWLISRNTITSHKYFWCSRFCECHSNQSTETLRKCLIRHYSYIFWLINLCDENIINLVCLIIKTF